MARENDMTTLRASIRLRTLGTLSACLLGATLVSSSAHAQTECPMPIPLVKIWLLESYVSLANGELPAYDASILASASGPDWLASHDAVSLARVLDGLPPETVEATGPETVARSTTGSMVRFDREKGSMRFVSQERQFDFDSFPHEAVPAEDAKTAVLSLARSLGLPRGEFEDPLTGLCLACRVDTLKGATFRTEDASGLPESVIDVERIVTVERRVNGLPVIGSRMRASISNEGEVARTLIRWPDFVPIGSVPLRDHADVAFEIGEKLFEVEEGVVPNDVTIRLAYMEIGGVFVPVAEVEVIDDLSGREVIVPLVDMGDDEDLDGVSDAVDSCPTRPNPAHTQGRDCNYDGDTRDYGEDVGEQCDRDEDGVGDPCDNCADAFNPAQGDADGNGVGDACEQDRGACQLPDGDGCDHMSAAACLEAGGSYAGDFVLCPEAIRVPLLPAWGAALLALALVAGRAATGGLRRQRRG